MLTDIFTWLRVTLLACSGRSVHWPDAISCGGMTEICGNNLSYRTQMYLWTYVNISSLDLACFCHRSEIDRPIQCTLCWWPLIACSNSFPDLKRQHWSPQYLLTAKFFVLHSPLQRISCTYIVMLPVLLGVVFRWVYKYVLCVNVSITQHTHNKNDREDKRAVNHPIIDMWIFLYQFCLKYIGDFRLFGHRSWWACAVHLMKPNLNCPCQRWRNLFLMQRIIKQ